LERGNERRGQEHSEVIRTANLRRKGKKERDEKWGI
jgi:hypothetical protein